ncbi:MAG TPA: CopD family protein, partial [Nitrososphaeraceae archaeon]|nr:CopD family protein [Nitrososphaeraceae archaeon]
FSKRKIFLWILMSGITLLIYFSDSASSSFESYSQVSSFEEPSSLMPQTETVTSYYDALLKIPLIVSQTAIVGVVFSHIFFQRIVRNRIQLNHNRDNSNTEIIDDDKIYLRSIKRLFMILLSCGIAMVISATSLLLLQAMSLSTELGMDMNTTFTILSSTPVGPVWDIRVITSLIIITSSILYYIFEKSNLQKQNQKGLGNIETNGFHLSKKTGKKGSLFQNILFCIIMLAGAVSIFSNSMVSHNTALSFLPLLAISLDWFHFMAVSMWLGGLFYISSILLMMIKLSIRKNGNIDDTVSKSSDVITVHDTSYFLALLLPYFSLMATISLGIIGVTGLYMAWIHLHTAGAIFTSSYGNILTVKLLLILPMVILGGYHQIKLHGSLMTVASLSKGRHKQQGAKINAYNMESSSDNNKGSHFSSQYDPSRKFSKTIRIESLIGIGVLVAASFLTITSPPSISLQESISTQTSLGQGGQQDYIPSFDSFTLLAIVLSVAVISGSIIYLKKSKKQLSDTIAYFEGINS